MISGSMEGGLNLREYQKNIIKSILEKGNTLVVLPTGTGKTFIAFYLLNHFREGVFLAPTKPLIKQHFENFTKLFPEYKERAALLIGEIPKSKRKNLIEKPFIFATPQTIEKEINNIKRKIIIFDECHRAVGKYSYSNISKKLENILKVGLTASPGGKQEKIKEVMENLGIKNVEIRTGEEEDIKDYVYSKKYRWEFVSLSPSLRQIKSLLKEEIDKYKSWFLKNKIRIPRTKSDLIKFREKLSNIPKPLYYTASSYYSILFNLVYLLEFAETQGYHYFIEYLEKIKQRKTRASLLIAKSENIKKAEYIAKKEIENSSLHPKFYKLEEILRKHNNTKVIVFFQYISTIKLAEKFLKEKGFDVVLLVGKRKGFSKKEQLKNLEYFREKENVVMLSSSVGEEGIDIPRVDVVVFFDVVPSEIRSIQRKGRAGRTGESIIYFIITSNTMEVAFYRAAKKREQLMKTKLKQMNKNSELKTKKEPKQSKIEEKHETKETKTLRRKEKTTIFDYIS